ncbi:PB1 domain protein (macronuclear) [Tetrahymena thermophila SB210]|uniref:PB1 domain protein n=1 Tax=Tetrahymena thermophila (strain SB210) TaxID=312017 RepID=Q24BZ8_TETTS|nr:PB1 domain protein [Tetrahymena thermophila SB210]EAS05304.1 PB1 domain protein [Tetrahymena thermophila SB210]|eukprot:XP_001025549.1 PB1 domain protein [Tetrahymena thermophila SB210]
MNSSKKISIKFQDKLIKLEESVKTFEDLKKVIKLKFDSLPDKIRIYYVDSDNDEITISCDEDLQSFQSEEKDIVINIKPYSDSDATDNEDFDDEEAEEEEEDEESSCCDSDSGEERAKVAQQKSLNQNDNKIEISKSLDKAQENMVQDGGNSQKREQIQNDQDVKDDEAINNSSFNDEFSDDDEVEEAEEQKNQDKSQNGVDQGSSRSQTRLENDQSVQCNFDSKNIETQDQQNQAGVTLKDQEQQIYTVHCDKSYQAQINQSDAQDQTLSAVCVDNSTQIQVESKDTQSQANVELIDNSFQTVRVDLQDKKTQAKIDQCDNQIQADLINMEDFQQQACSNQNKSLSSQPEIQVESLKQEQHNQKSEIQSFMPYLERIKQLEENQAQLLKVLEKQSQQFESQIQNLQQNLINENVEEKIKQFVDNRVNELLPEYSRANWENFRRQEKISRFDRIFQELIPKFNNLALITDSNLLNTSYDELTTTLIQKLEIARDMQLKELIQSQVNQKNHSSNISDEMIAKSQIKQQQINIEEDIEEESKEISNPSNQKKQQDEKVDSSKLVMVKKDSRYEDDCVVEERLKQQQEKIRKEKQLEEENIKKILKEKENQALQLNQEIIQNLHKDYPEEIVNKAKQIASLTQENPNIYLQYVLDYKNLTVNDLIDQIYTTNVMERYQEK